VFEIVLTSAERALLEALNALGVRYLIVGMGAALIEGAPGTTQDIDLWFEQIDEGQLHEAALRAGGLYTSGFGLQPPAVGGEGLDRVDLVLTASGLEPFDQEFKNAREYDVDGVRVRVLPLDRVIISKRAAKRAKDLAQIPILEAALAARRARTEDDKHR
jgi:predicted nucleotidyltransferase